MDYQYITCALLLLFIDNTACSFFYRATLSVSASLLSFGVCLSVRLIRWCIVSRWLKISSNFFLGLVAPSF